MFSSVPSLLNNDDLYFCIENEESVEMSCLSSLVSFAVGVTKQACVHAEPDKCFLYGLILSYPKKYCKISGGSHSRKDNHVSTGGRLL